MRVVFYWINFKFKQPCLYVRRRIDHPAHLLLAVGFYQDNDPGLLANFEDPLRNNAFFDKLPCFLIDILFELLDDLLTCCARHHSTVT